MNQIRATCVHCGAPAPNDRLICATHWLAIPVHMRTLPLWRLTAFLKQRFASVRVFDRAARAKKKEMNGAS